jgi:branched-chain amino acid transport system permease protein
MIGLKGFIAAAFGGLGRYEGAVVGGLTLGLLEAFGAGYVSSAYKDVFSLGLLVVLLLLRPQGLLGGRVITS